MPISLGGGTDISLVNSAFRSTFFVSLEISGVFVVEAVDFWIHARARLMDEEWRVLRGLLECRCIVIESRIKEVMCSSTRPFNVFFDAGYIDINQVYGNTKKGMNELILLS
jgi:hypothetical protein